MDILDDLITYLRKRDRILHQQARMTAVTEHIIVQGIGSGLHLIPGDFKKRVVVCHCRSGVTVRRDNQQCPFGGEEALNNESQTL